MAVSLDRPYLVCGLIYGALGMMLGIHMGITQNHGQHVTHAHLLLVGLVVSVLYAVIHRLWLDNPNRLASWLQFFGHQLGTVLMVAGLFLMYGGYVSPQSADPLLGVASIVVAAALVLMLVLVLVNKRRA